MSFEVYVVCIRQPCFVLVRSEYYKGAKIPQRNESCFLSPAKQQTTTADPAIIPLNLNPP
jgi:hypothetical protein